MENVTHTVDFEVQAHYARMNPLAWTYYDIAESAYLKILLERKNLIPSHEDEDPTPRLRQRQLLMQLSFQTIVFSAMSCEAAIFDLAAIQLGDDYASKYLDKLDLVSKWVVVPPLICGRSMNTDGPAINALRELTRLRNALVHHKSLPGITEPEMLKKADKQMRRFFDGTDLSFKTMILLSLELHRVLKVRSGALPFFEGEIVKLNEGMYPEPILEVISKCREIDNRNAS
jgi:hypothetical protein